MRARSVAAIVCLVPALAVGLVACGDDDDGSGASTSTGSNTLTIYSSLPLRGEARAQSESVVNGMKLALEESGGKVGGFTVKYVSLDDSTAATGDWEPGQVSANAQRAAQDRTTIAYLGELGGGASAISIPLVNEAGILQVSPGETKIGFTEADGAEKGEPDKYYPTGRRTFGRIVPADDVQAAAQVSYQRDEGCTTLAVLHDRSPYGKGLADGVARVAADRELEVLDTQAINPRSDDFSSVAQDVVADDADCVFFGGSTPEVAALVWRDLHAADGELRLFGPDALAQRSFAGAIGRAAARTRLTVPTLAPELYPPAAQEFFRRYEEAFGEPPESYGIHGYEAMKVTLAAIEEAGSRGNDRQAVIDAFFRTRDRRSVLGTYSITEKGDTTLSDYGTMRVERGRLVFDRVVKADED